MSAPKSSDKPTKKIENTTERQIKSVSAPVAEPISRDVLFQKKKVQSLRNSGKTVEEVEQTVVNIPILQQHLFGEGRLKREDVVWIIEKATELFAREPNVLKIDHQAITVCGDVHGQFYDLVKLFEVGGDPASTTYLFLGDYVDRGSFSIEVVLLLYANKINYPRSFFMIRGNHECRHLTQYFTFKEECIHKYDIEIYNLVMDSFDALPLAAIMSKQFLCVHGGISPDIQTIDDIRNIDRFREPPESGPMCDLLWADPIANFNTKSEETFEYNDIRGCSYMYGYKAVVSFLERNNLLSIIRAHEVQDQGYRMHPKNEATGFPTVITIFSAPNYLDAYNNKGAVLRYEKNIMNIRQFNHSPHPYWLPNFMDVFNWSMPFVAEKVGEILLAVLNLCNDEEDEKEEAKQQESDAEKEKRRQELRAKVKSVSKILRMYSILRQERETLMMIKSFTPENKIPQGLLSGGVVAIRDALGDFEKAKDVDKVNEKRPAISANEQLPKETNEKLKNLRDSWNEIPQDDDDEQSEN